MVFTMFLQQARKQKLKIRIAKTQKHCILRCFWPVGCENSRSKKRLTHRCLQCFVLVWFLLLWTYNWSYIYLAFVNSTLTFASYNYSYKSCTLTFRKKSPLHKKRKTLEHAPCACFLSPEWCFRLNIWDCFLYFRLVYPENDLQTKFPKTIQN